MESFVPMKEPMQTIALLSCLASYDCIIFKTMNKETGYFGPDSITWQIYREPTFLAGSVRALLLQVAHPAVAEGVARYSNFEKDAYGRGKRTFEAMAMIYFGDCRQADFAAKGMAAMHKRIQGSYTKVAEGKTLSIPFHADDPKLKCWILATLFDTTLVSYESVFGEIEFERKRLFFEESKKAAQLLSIPLEVYPANYEAFRLYFDNMLSGDELYIGDTGKKIARAILKHKYAPRKITRILATGFLPEHLSGAFNIPRYDADKKAFKRLMSLIKIGVNCIPATMRWVPAYRQACRRIDLANNRPSTVAGRFYNWLGSKINLPLGIPDYSTNLPGTEKG